MKLMDININNKSMDNINNTANIQQPQNSIPSPDKEKKPHMSKKWLLIGEYLWGQ